MIMVEVYDVKLTLRTESSELEIVGTSLRIYNMKPSTSLTVESMPNKVEQLHQIFPNEPWA